MEAQKLRYTPYLIQAYIEGKTPDYEVALANKGWDPNTRAFPALVGEVLDIVWQSNSGPTGGFEYHPMHAHGEHYWDLGSGNGTYDATANEEHFKNYTPMKRDTTMLHRYASKGADYTTAGWRAWRIRVTNDNVGAWMMHCHILQHMIMGKLNYNPLACSFLFFSTISYFLFWNGETLTLSRNYRHANCLGLWRRARDPSRDPPALH